MSSKIIKGDNLSAPLPDRLPLRQARPVVDSATFDAHQKAKEIIQEAERKAAQINEQASLEREEAMESAQEEGYQNGLAQASEILLQAREEAAEIIAASESELIRLSLVIAEKIIGRSLEIDQHSILAIVAQAVENVRQQREIVLRIHPEDAKIIRENRRELLDMLGRIKDIAIKEDGEVTRGGCIIETESGTIDASLDAQLAMLKQRLLGENNFNSTSTANEE